MALVSYIKNSLRFCIMLPLVPIVKILKKVGVTGKIWEKVGVKLLRDLIKKSVNFSTLATSNIRLLLVFGEEDQKTKLVRLVKLGKLTKQSPFLSPNFIRGSTVIVIPHNVELCKQYFLQECLLLIRKSCN